jgi:DNA repair protein RadA/Sms
VLEGTRPLLVEVQALVADRTGPAPRRSATGFDSARLSLLLAVLQQHAGLEVADRDVYASIAGGVRVTEPGVDLAVALAVAGARLGVSAPASLVAIGEVGLGGEIRQVPQTARRLGEAARLGFTHAIGPAALPAVDGVAPTRVATLADALAVVYPTTAVRAA